MKKTEKFIVDLCFDVFGAVNTENKKKIKKVIDESEIETIFEQMADGKTEYSKVVLEVKKRIEIPQFFTFPALSVVEDLFFDLKTEKRFFEKFIEGKDGCVCYADDGDNKNNFQGAENYLLYILMFTFSGRKTNTKELYNFCTGSTGKVNAIKFEEFERKLFDLAENLRKKEVVVSWQGKSSVLLSEFKKDAKSCFFNCQKFRDLLENKLISIPQKILSKSKIDVVLKKIEIVKAVRNWNRYNYKYSNRVIVNKIEKKLKSNISAEFLKEFCKNLKEYGLVEEFELEVKHGVKSIVLQQKSSQELPITPYLKNGNLIAYYAKGNAIKNLIGVFYSKANFHFRSGQVRFDDRILQLTESQKQKIKNWFDQNLEKWMQKLKHN